MSGKLTLRGGLSEVDRLCCRWHLPAELGSSTVQFHATLGDCSQIGARSQVISS